MTDRTTEVFVISDLHVGGRYPAADAAPGERGFRMCTRVDALTRFVVALADRAGQGAPIELVINGDFIDFLAEEHEAQRDGDDGEAGPAPFLPFLQDEPAARRTLREIATRDAALFRALAALVTASGRLTILLGNHDVELSLPAVRRDLAELLDPERSGRFAFVYDGEAYAVADAVIEHGNRYDGFNVVDHDALRRMRSLLSRRQPVPPEYMFEAPPGSRLVAEIMNPIKKDYPFVDLLKPEIETVIPLLLALEPSYRARALKIYKLKKEAAKHAPIAPAMPAYGGDVGAEEEGDAGEPARPARETVDSMLRDILPRDAAARLSEALRPEGDVSGDVSSYGASEILGLVKLAVSGDGRLERRLPGLLDALRAARDDRSFDRSFETETAYLEAAQEHARNGFRYVVLGHTHLAKRVDLGDEKVYFNTGTWADLIQFPEGILDRKNPKALSELRAFVADLAARRFDRWIRFSPTYVRLVVQGDRVTEAELCDFDPSR